MSCVEDHWAHANLDQVQKRIEEEVQKLENVSNRLPTSWMAVKVELECSVEDYIPFSEYKDVCTRNGVTDDEDQRVLMRFLHDLGVMLNYAHKLKFEETHVLNPTWVTEGIYALILSDELQAAEGELDSDLLAKLDVFVERMLRKEKRIREGETYEPRYKGKDAQRFILEMMKKFNLCYELPGESGADATYLVPNALSRDEPQIDCLNLNPNNALYFELYYPRLLPTSIISRFMVHMEARPKEATLWRQGIRSKLDGVPYRVTLHDRERRIKVAICHENVEKRIATLETIRHGLTLANRSKKGLEWEEWIPLPEKPSVAIQRKVLLQYAEKGQKKPLIPCSDGEVREVVVENHLRGIGEPSLVRRLLQIPEQQFETGCQSFFPDIFEKLEPTMSFRKKVQFLVTSAERDNWTQRLEDVISSKRFGHLERKIEADDRITECNAKGPHSTAAPKATVSRIVGGSEEPFERDQCWSILHLSDFHFTGETKPEPKLEWLINDLNELDVTKPNFAVLSGDFTDKGNEEGLQRAAKFVDGLCHRLKIKDRSRCLVVPGNHDVTDLEEAYDYKRQRPDGIPDAYVVQEGRGFLIRNPIEHQKRLKRFSDLFYETVFGKPYPLDPTEQGFVYTFPAERVQFWLLNSAWEVDEFDRGRATIHPDALAKTIRNAAAEQSDSDLLKIGVWHHSIRTDPPGQPLKDPSFLETHLRKNGVRLGMHGDVHKFERQRIGYEDEQSNLHIVGGGAFASPDEGMPHGMPRLYNLLLIRKDLTAMRVHTRKQTTENGAWEGWHTWHSRSNPDSDARYPYFELELGDPKT